MNLEIDKLLKRLVVIIAKYPCYLKHVAQYLFHQEVYIQSGPQLWFGGMHGICHGSGLTTHLEVLLAKCLCECCLLAALSQP